MDVVSFETAKRLKEAGFPQPDKKAIKEAIEAGEEVPGAVIVNKTRVEIK